MVVLTAWSYLLMLAPMAFDALVASCLGDGVGVGHGVVHPLPRSPPGAANEEGNSGGVSKHCWSGLASGFTSRTRRGRVSTTSFKEGIPSVHRLPNMPNVGVRSLHSVINFILDALVLTDLPPEVHVLFCLVENHPGSVGRERALQSPQSIHAPY